MKIDVLIQASSRYPIRRKRIKLVVEKVLESVQLDGKMEVEINIVGDRKMRQLKKEHLGVDQTTDVLSFPLHEDLYKKGKDENWREPDEKLRLGTIFVSYPQARKQANLHKLLIDDEIDQLIEHGMLHLVGIHHE